MKQAENFLTSFWIMLTIANRQHPLNLEETMLEYPVSLRMLFSLSCPPSA